MTKWEFSCVESEEATLSQLQKSLQALGAEGWEPVNFTYLPSMIQGGRGRTLIFSRKPVEEVPIGEVSTWDFQCTEVAGENLTDLMGHLHTLGQEGWTPIYFNYINAILHGAAGKMFVVSKRPTADGTETPIQ